jgi:hypothetical protein
VIVERIGMVFRLSLITGVEETDLAPIGHCAASCAAPWREGFGNWKPRTLA